MRVWRLITTSVMSFSATQMMRVMCVFPDPVPRPRPVEEEKIARTGGIGEAGCGLGLVWTELWLSQDLV